MLEPFLYGILYPQGVGESLGLGRPKDRPQGIIVSPLEAEGRAK